MRSTLPPVSEAQFLRQVLALAKLRGWLCHHCRSARTARGWRTPIQGDAGFPDLVLARRSSDRTTARVLFVELKSDRGYLASPQFAWLQALQATGAEVHVWRPSQWDAIQKILS